MTELRVTSFGDRRRTTVVLDGVDISKSVSGFEVRHTAGGVPTVALILPATRLRFEGDDSIVAEVL